MIYEALMKKNFIELKGNKNHLTKINLFVGIRKPTPS